MRVWSEPFRHPSRAKRCLISATDPFEGGQDNQYFDHLLRLACRSRLLAGGRRRPISVNSCRHSGISAAPEGRQLQTSDDVLRRPAGEQTLVTQPNRILGRPFGVPRPAAPVRPPRRGGRGGCPRNRSRLCNRCFEPTPKSSCPGLVLNKSGHNSSTFVYHQSTTGFGPKRLSPGQRCRRRQRKREEIIGVQSEGARNRRTWLGKRREHQRPPITGPTRVARAFFTIGHRIQHRSATSIGTLELYRNPDRRRAIVSSACGRQRKQRANREILIAGCGNLPGLPSTPLRESPVPG